MLLLLFYLSAEEVEGFVKSMEDLRIEAIKYNLHLPKPFEVVGDDEVCKITWKDFLLTRQEAH